jgi:hypothetical protein
MKSFPQSSFALSIGMSSSPVCTPSAPHARAMSTLSSTIYVVFFSRIFLILSPVSKNSFVVPVFFLN